MAAFSMTLDGIYSFFYIGFFLLCCGYLWNAVYAVVLKRKNYVAHSFALECCCLFGLQNVSYAMTEPKTFFADNLYRHVSGWPPAVWILLVIVLTIFWGIMIWRIVTWRICHISTMSIKDCGDGHPAGIVFWYDNGRVAFSNATANRICESIMDNPVMNGTEFLKNLGESPVRLDDGSVWKFRHRISTLDGETIHELIATDCTEIYRKTQAIEADTKRLEKVNQELREYNRQIEELVSRQEILNAKISIHDHMNYLLMTTGRVFAESDKENQKELLMEWETAAVLLFHEQENEHRKNIRNDLCTYGELLGIAFVCDLIPDFKDREIAKIVVLSAREAMHNAVKHGNAKHLAADFREEKTQWICVLKNDGSVPDAGTFSFTGGLRHISEEVRQLGGTIRVETKSAFQLIITIPKGESPK